MARLNRPFLFLGHGEGSTSAFRLWLVARDPGSAFDVAAVLQRWADRFGLRLFAPTTSGVVRINTSSRGAALKDQTALRALEECLDTIHATVPLGLVVREGRVKPSDWHRESLEHVEAALALLAAHVSRKSAYNEPPLRIEESSTRLGSVHETALESLAYKAPLAEMVLATLRVVRRTAGKRFLPVWDDLLQERLPPLFGKRFDVDIVLVAELAQILGVGPASIPVADAFRAALAQGFAGPDEKHASINWSKTAEVVAALTAARWGDLEKSFDESNPDHEATMAALSHEQRQALLPFGHFTTRMANAANCLVMRGDFERALIIYDSVMTADEIHPGSCGTPLFAAMDDNNKLGINRERVLRYLERCLPHGPENPVVFLNASGLYAELSDADACLRMIALAKEHGVDVKKYKHDAPYSLVRETKTFRDLMK